MIIDHKSLSALSSRLALGDQILDASILGNLDAVNYFAREHESILAAATGVSARFSSLGSNVLNEQFLGVNSASTILDKWAIGGYGAEVARVLESTRFQLPLADAQLAKIAASFRLPNLDFLTNSSLAEVYGSLLREVQTIVRPADDFELTARLGARFQAGDFFQLHRADDVRHYLRRTELAQTFVESPQPLVGRTLRDLRVAEPLPANLIRNASPKRFKANVLRRDGATLRLLLDEFEFALRRRIAQVMEQRHGPNWAREARSEKLVSWVKRLDKKTAANGTPEFTPQKVLEVVLFSELLEFAFRSEDCAPHVLVVSWLSEEQIKMEIDLACEARNAVAHGFSRANPSQIVVACGTLVKLAGLAGFSLDSVFANEDEDVESYSPA